MSVHRQSCLKFGRLAARSNARRSSRRFHDILKGPSPSLTTFGIGRIIFSRDPSSETSVRSAVGSSSVLAGLATSMKLVGTDAEMLQRGQFLNMLEGLLCQCIVV